MLCKNILCVKIYQTALIGCSDICWHGIFLGKFVGSAFSFRIFERVTRELNADD
jgi:hypothetical protein